MLDDLDKTAEWNLADHPWLDAEDDPQLTTPPLPPPSSPPAAPPLPPSRRGGSRTTAFTAGAAEPLGAIATSRPLITLPKKPQPGPVQPAPPVVVAADLGATLPPRAEREAAAAALHRDVPSVERNVELPRESRGTRLGRGRAPVVAMGGVLLCTLGYTFWASRGHSTDADGADGAIARAVPQFLRESTAAAASPPAPRSTLPPELAATLAEALPASTGDALSPTDAGAPPAQPPLEQLSLPTDAAQTAAPAPVATENTERANALRAALEAQRIEPEAQPPEANPKAPATRRSRPDPAAPRHSAPTKTIVTEWPGDTDGLAAKIERYPDKPTRGAARARLRPSTAIRPLTTYAYEPKELYSVVTAPMRVTDVALEQGEKLTTQPTAGDAARWVISVVQGDPQTHVFVKPLRPGLTTNLTLTTDRRSYHLELSTRDDGAYMAAVAWQYPIDEAARRREVLVQAARERQSTTAVSDLQALRFDYSIEVTAGSPPWKPTLVFDDGQKTFIRFARPVSSGPAPVLFVLRAGSTKDAKFVNYRQKSDLYVVDRIVDAAELRLANGDREQDVVRITRRHSN
jgi:type IV secretion system protein TrbG